MRTITCRTMLFVLTLMFSSAAFPSFGQGGTSQVEPQTVKGAVIKGRAPVNKNVLRVKLPKAHEATLKNGLHVVLLESNHRLPTFSMEMVVLSGGLSDPADKRGLAGATAALLRERTTKRTRENCGTAETIGASVGATSGAVHF